MTTQKKPFVSNKVYRFIQDVYPDFYSKCWLGEGIHDKYVDNFIDRIVKIIEEVKKWN